MAITRIEKSALVRFPSRSMFELVADIESYPQFLPWCQGSRILQRIGDVVEAELDIVRGGFRKTFATRNRNNGFSEIHMDLIDGPFQHLEGVWRFVSLREDASKISLDLEFELVGTLAGLAFGPVFNQICNNMVGAFSQRARELYGRTVCHG